MNAPHEALRRVQRAALAAGAVGLALSLVGTVAAPTQFLRSYLAAWLLVTGTSLGCIAILMINHVTGGAWGAVIRRILESGARTLPVLAVLFLPLVLGAPRLWEWASPEAVARDPVLQHKHVYLNLPFFLVRAALYFFAWITVTRSLTRWSLEQDATLDPFPTERLELLSRGGLVLMGLTMTFASIDWVMSLEPHWSSTIYGVIFMGGSVLSAFAFAIPVAVLLAQEKPLDEVITADRLHDLGKLLLAFVMLWAYFSFSQFLITWAGNLPEEIPWYLARTRGGWQWIGLALAVFHFALPFVVLLSREVKRRARTLAVVAVALVVMRVVDMLWLVKPAFQPAGFSLHWLDVATVMALGGLWLALVVRHLEERPVVPLHDPSLGMLA
jgi:hypothetical protein